MKNKKGFTLVELLAVLLLLSIIMALALPAIFTMNKRIKNRGFDSKIELIEKAAINYAQNNANSIKSAIDAKTSVICSSNTSCNDIKTRILNNIYTVNESKASCKLDYIKEDGVLKEPAALDCSKVNKYDVKYVFQVNLKTLIESGYYKLDNENTNSDCKVKDPVDESKCLDCVTIEVWLDDNHKNATAYFGKDDIKQSLKDFVENTDKKNSSTDTARCANKTPLS